MESTIGLREPHDGGNELDPGSLTPELASCRSVKLQAPVVLYTYQ